MTTIDSRDPDELISILTAGYFDRDRLESHGSYVLVARRVEPYVLEMFVRWWLINRKFMPFPIEMAYELADMQREWNLRREN